jgi:hypothetical protein
MIKYCYLIFCFIIVSSIGFSQKTVVHGTVTDAKTKETLPFVNVGFKGTKTGTSTDFDGKYHLESYYVSDSLIFSFLGYESITIRIITDKTQEINIELKESSVTLKAAVISASKKDENPAHAILKQVIRNKKINNKEKLDAYSYEVYNKVEFDINNIDEKFKNRKVFKKFDFIFEYVDSTDDKPYLPIFITESVSDYYYERFPKKRKEIIKAAKVSGLNNQSISQYLGDMYQNINVYDNSIQIFGRNFISPVNFNALFYYKYYLTDSTTIDGNWCYKIEFKPRRQSDLTFIGEMWIHDTTYAVKVFEGDISESANINFVNSYLIKQTFSQVEPEVWMMTLDESVVDVNPLESDKQKGIYGRKITSYKNFTINKEIPDSVFDGAENITVAENAREFKSSYWDTARHVTLTEKEKKIYHMIDTVKDLPIMKTYVDFIQTITTGYKILGPIEIGPYSSLYSYNLIEGHRVSIGMQTSNYFSKKIMLTGHLAYGFGDENYKYGFGTKFFITKKPRRLIEIDYINEVKQFDRDYFDPFSQNILSSFLRRNPYNKLVNIEGGNFKYTNEWYEGLSNSISFRSYSVQSLDTFLTFNKLNPIDSSLANVNSFSNSEITIGMRFAHNEKYLSGEFTRISLGTKYPVIEANFSMGVKNLLKSQYDYKKLVINYKHYFNIGYFGYTAYAFEAGKTWGTLPYPLLFVHTGNETYGYERNAFNAMNIGEFISDQYISLTAEHHFEGLFLNRFPLLRKLKWREVIGGKMIYGQLNDKHKDVFALPYYSSTLKENPYSEVSIGIENIFKVLRIDALWRLSYLNNNSKDINVLKFGIRAKLQIRF